MSKFFLMICITFTKNDMKKKEILQIKKTHKKVDYANLRLLDDYLYEEEDKNLINKLINKLANKLIKKPDKKKKLLKNQQKLV